MTQDDARAEAERRYPAFRSATGRDIWPNSVNAFQAGAKWAREQGPTEGQVEAAARAIYEQTDWSGCAGSAWDRLDDREDYYPLARAVLRAAKEAK